jgi:pyridinium-3,5-bisthiocarboxylic acid mononucleotide nickel chelatase
MTMAAPEDGAEHVVVIECNLDDMTGEALGYAMDRLFAAGAVDVWFTPIYMKKNRPGTMLSVLCRPEQASALGEAILRETTTLGVRWRAYERLTAGRAVDAVRTPWGVVRRKVKSIPGHAPSIKAEFEDCARLARQHQIPLRDVVAWAERSTEEVDPTSVADQPGDTSRT